MTRSLPLRSVLGTALLAGLLSCAGREPTRPATASADGPSFPEGVSAAISDASRPNGIAGFNWLPPLSPRRTSYSAAFDATLSPTVEVCEWVADACARVVATMTKVGTADGSVTVNPRLEAYETVWRTRSGTLDATTTYRVRVSLNSTVVGFADIDVLKNVWGLFGVDYKNFFPLLAGLELPIRFRLSQGLAPAVVTVDVPTEGGDVTLPGSGSLHIPSGALVGTARLELRQVPGVGATLGGSADPVLGSVPVIAGVFRASFTTTAQPNLDLAATITLPPGIAASSIVPVVRAFSGGGEQRFRYIATAITAVTNTTLDVTVPVWAFANIEQTGQWTTDLVLLQKPAATPIIRSGSRAPAVALNVSPNRTACEASGFPALLAPMTVYRPDAPAASGPWGVLRTRQDGSRYYHPGVDLQADPNTPVYAAASGIAILASDPAGFGLFVQIAHDDGSTTLYGHLQQAAGVLDGLQVGGPGRRVVMGQLIARSGASGNAATAKTGGLPNPQLHFEFWPNLPTPPQPAVEFGTPKFYRTVDPDPCTTVIDRIVFTPATLALDTGAPATAISAKALAVDGTEITGVYNKWTAADPAIVNLSPDVSTNNTAASQFASARAVGTTSITDSIGGREAILGVTVVDPQGAGCGNAGGVTICLSGVRAVRTLDASGKLAIRIVTGSASLNGRGVVGGFPFGGFTPPFDVSQSGVFDTVTSSTYNVFLCDGIAGVSRTAIFKGSSSIVYLPPTQIAPIFGAGFSASIVFDAFDVSKCPISAYLQSGAYFNAATGLAVSARSATVSF